MNAQPTLTSCSTEETSGTATAELTYPDEHRHANSRSQPGNPLMRARCIF